jgi:hypothetical protein
MTGFLGRAARAGSFAMITLSLAACGPDDSTGAKLADFALAGSQQPGGWPVGDALPHALPMLASGPQDYALAPAWDYGRNSYADYEPASPYGSYDTAYDGYAQDGPRYYDESAGSNDYAWLALATLIAGVIGDSPPDYRFDQGGVEPWAWQTRDGYVRYAEPVYGGERYYYYQPHATRPFLVRDPFYSYGYRDGRVMAVYDRNGRLLSNRAAERQRVAAQQYLQRAQRLYRAARAERHQAIVTRQWEQRRATLAADRRALLAARARQSAWRNWDRQHENDLRKGWQRERTAREQSAKRYENWRAASYRVPPSQRVAVRDRAIEHRPQPAPAPRARQQVVVAHQAALRAQAQRSALAGQRRTAGRATVERERAAAVRLQQQRQASARRQAAAQQASAVRAHDERKAAQARAAAQRNSQAQARAAAAREKAATVQRTRQAQAQAAAARKKAAVAAIRQARQAQAVQARKKPATIRRSVATARSGAPAHVERAVSPKAATPRQATRRTVTPAVARGAHAVAKRAGKGRERN